MILCMNMSGNDYRRLDTVRQILMIGDGGMRSVRVLFPFSLDGTSSRGRVAFLGFVGIKESLNKRRHALNMCKR